MKTTWNCDKVVKSQTNPGQNVSTANLENDHDATIPARLSSDLISTSQQNHQQNPIVSKIFFQDPI